MPDIIDHVAYLSQQIGPRPAGTEEEQQAALYITEQMQKDAGLSAVIEDFSGASNDDMPRAICSLATIVAGVLGLVLPLAAIPAIIISLIALLLIAAEVFDKPILSKALSHGVSQNVVAKYEPGYLAESGGTRRRKVVVVARYDSGKVRAELKPPLVGVVPIMRWATLGAMALVFLVLLVRATLFPPDEGLKTLLLTVLLIIGLVLSALPIIEALLHKLAAYNEGANCNATGAAVLMEVARRVGRGRVSEAELAARDEEAVVHGEEAARAAGLVPEGAQIVYASSHMKPPEPAPQSEGERLAAAKAAVAALTGKPVSNHYSADIADNLVQVKEPPLSSPSDEAYQEQRGETREALMTIPAETVQAALAHASGAVEEHAGVEQVMPAFAAAVDAAPAMPTPDEEAVPDWFKKAQEKAKKPAKKAAVQRSRYAEALDAALAVANTPEEEAARTQAPVGERVQPAREGAAQAQPPQRARAAEEAPVASPLATPLAAPAAPVAPAPHSEAPQPQEPVAVPEDAPAAEPHLAAEPNATTAMPPIDVSELRLGDVPPMEEVRMPSFLDPSVAQAEKLEQRGDEQRTSYRVDVTEAEIGASGRIEQLPAQQDVQPAAAADEGGAAAVERQPTRRPIVLPDIAAAATNLTPIGELQKQRAPLAEAVETSGKSAAKSLLTMLPSISPHQENNLSAPEAQHAAGAPSSAGSDASAPRVDLRTSLPSLSGSITRQGDGATVSTTGAFVPAGATGAFAPVGDELLENVDPEDIYVDDADDSAYEGEYTETGAFAGAGYVEMPKSRGRRFFDRFRRKNKQTNEQSAQEWLEVDESFDPRSAGAARGGWESFRDEDQAPSAYDTEYDEDFIEPLDDDEASPYYDANDAYDEEEFTEGDTFVPDPRPENPRHRWKGGGFSQRHDVAGARDDASRVYDEEVADDYPQDPETPPELEQIYQFRNPDINTEVWFVALGSELAHHDGMRAFLAEHNQELRGSIIIEIDALGAGDLSLIEREGMYKKVKVSSRMKRYAKKASQATGLPIQTAAILWGDGASSTAMRQGFQGMHIAGMDGRKPAYFAQADDVMENINEETLQNNADFVMELLKNI